MAEKKEKIVEIIETKSVNLKGYTLIEGFPGLGLSGTIGAKYIVEKLKFEQFGHIDSKFFMPVIRIQNGIPMHPVRLYADKKSKIAVVLAEQIISHELSGVIAKELVDWIKSKGISTVISTSGINTAEPINVYAFASNEKSKEIIKKNNIKLIETGITSGVTAMMLLYLKDNKINAFCILGNTKSNADYRAAAELIKTISTLTKLKIDVKPLLKEAKVMEDALLNHLKTLETEKANEENLITTSSSKPPMYT
jgi:uncharacterized protein